MAQEILSPPGRIVWGNPIKAQKQTDDNGNVKKDDDGNDKLQWSFGFAVPKDQCGEIFTAMNAAAAEEFPNGVPGNFAWKFKDGDTGVDAKGNPLRDKPGQAGCFIFAITTYFQVPPFYVYDFVKQQYEPRADGLKTGDFVRVQIQFVAHKAMNNLSKPGLYINPQFVLFHETGEEIASGGPNPNALGIAPPPKPPTPPAGAVPGQPAPTAPPAPASPPGAPQTPPQVPGGVPGASAPPAAPYHQFTQGPRPDDN